MANTRIRYSRDSQGNFTSVKKFTHATNGARYQVKLNTTESQWLILDDASGLVAASGLNTSMSKMKIEVKKALEVLGITFESEKRNTNPFSKPIVVDIAS